MTMIGETNVEWGYAEDLVLTCRDTGGIDHQSNG